MTARCVFLNRRFIYIFYHFQQGELYRAEIGAKDGVLFSNLLAVALRCFFFFYTSVMGHYNLSSAVVSKKKCQIKGETCCSRRTSINGMRRNFWQRLKNLYMVV